MKRPKPELIETKDGWKVTDGWVGTSYFRVVKQPSKETIINLHKHFCELVSPENLIKKGIYNNLETNSNKQK